jgi:hypothetical protein
MNKGVVTAAVFTTALFVWPASATSEPIETTIAVTVNLLNGRHEVGRRKSERLTFAPLPLVEVTLRHGSESLHLEGLPPIGFNSGSGTDTSIGNRATRLSVLNVTLRQAIAGGWFAGIGETVYTQHTVYTDLPQSTYFHNGYFYFVNGSETDSSRVAGLRLEVGRNVTVGRDRMEFAAAVNPSMHGREAHAIPYPTFGNAILGFSDPETATQIDAYARLAHRVSSNGEVLVGFRYINFTAHYSDAPGALADHNVGWAPVLGFRLRL